MEHLASDSPVAVQKMEAVGLFHVEQWRDGELIAAFDFKNMITNLGKNLMLGRMFNAVSNSSGNLWYIGVIGNTTFSAVNPSDIMGSGTHSGWTEYTSITGNRAAWGQGAASGQQVVNGSAVSITLNAVDTINGIFIVDNNGMGGNSGNLWSTALFPTPLPNQAGDILKITYAVQL